MTSDSLSSDPVLTLKTDDVAFYVSVPDPDYGTVRQCVVDREFARAQERRIAELEKDAARYRWLRHGDNDELVLSETDGATFLLRNEDLDDAIDEQLEDEAAAIQDAQS